MQGATGMGRDRFQVNLQGTSQQELLVSAIVSLVLNGADYGKFVEGTEARLSGLPNPDFLFTDENGRRTAFQFDGYYWHRGPDRLERDVRVTDRHLAGGVNEVVRFRDRLDVLPDRANLICFVVNASHTGAKLISAVFTAMREIASKLRLTQIEETATHINTVQEWAAKRVTELVTVPVERQPGLTYLRQYAPAAGLLLKHYRLPFERPEFFEKFKTFCDAVGREHVWKMVSLSFDLTVDMDALLRWHESLGNKQFARFMCNSVAARLAGADAATFEAKLERWRAILGNEQFVSFMCDGVAARLVGADAATFEAKLDRWHETLGNEQFVSFMCDGVAARLVGADAETFEAELERWREILGNKQFASCMCDCVAARLTDDGFYRAIVDLTTAKPELKLSTAFVCALLSTGSGCFAVRFWPMKPSSSKARQDASAFRDAVKNWIRTAKFPRSLPKYVRRAIRTDGAAKGLAVREGHFLADLVE
jgi:hypothetical protein